MTALQFLAKLLKLMRSSYNTFNANQRLKHKYQKSKDCKEMREQQARRTFTFCFENCNETNARNSTQVRKSNKKAHCGIKRRNITKQKAIKRRKRRKAKRNCQNTNRKLTRREEKNMNGKSCRTCGTVKVKAKVRVDPQQEPFRLFTDFGSNEFNLLR